MMLKTIKTTNKRGLPAQPDGNYEALREAFTDPSSDFRGKPFWAWNSAIDESEVLEQIDIMKQMGMGGFFIHARTGLKTPYLSSEWFRLVKVCCRKAERLDMQVWLYDEDRWPSGFAGGLVTQDVRFRQRRLRMEVFAPSQFVWRDDDLAVFSACVSGSQAASVKRLDTPADVLAAAGTQILAFSIRVAAPSDGYNGQTYVDTLSETAIARFIEVTHEAYRRHVGEYFGGVIKGIFTDEPNHGPTCVAVSSDGGGELAVEIPWTETLPEVFRRRYGYDIIDYLPEVFFDTDKDGVQLARHHYHDCKTHLFVNAFSRQISRWCQENKLLMTGHVLHESPLHAQVSAVGSAMRFYEHMHVPGIDILTDCHFQTDGNPEYDTPKQCVSVQRQMGRKQVLSELYGCTGWDFPLEGHKTSGDWQAALGVSLRCHHLLWYNMQGQSKRDYPASIFYQSPWWQHYKYVEDYFSRINVLMTEGRSTCKLLVLHPNETMWQMAKIGWITFENRGIDKWVPSRAVRELEDQYVHIRDALIESNIDFDYGDEEMLSRLGDVDGVEPKIIIGQSSYEAVLVPPLKTIRKSTLDLLTRFVHRGGKVFVVDKMPDYVDAVKSPYARHFQKICCTLPLDTDALTIAVKDMRTLEVTDADGHRLNDVLTLCSQDPNHFYLFVCNTNKQKGYEAITLQVRHAGPFKYAEQWDPQDGRVYGCTSQRRKDALYIETSLPPAGSAMFVLAQKDRHPTCAPAGVSTVGRIELSGPYTYDLSEHNVLVLDRARFTLPGQTPSAPLDILKIDTLIREKTGLKPRQGKMVQPWLQQQNTLGRYAVDLVFTFDVETVPDSALLLAMEQPESISKVSINDHPIDLQQDFGWWIDKSLRQFSLDARWLRSGCNTLRMTVFYDQCMGLEAVYLRGQFGVRIDGGNLSLTSLPPQLTASDWCGQGLPFYSGSVAYRCVFESAASSGQKTYLSVPRFGGSCLRVAVNGTPAKTVWNRPYEVNITEAVLPGRNTAVIEVLSHRRNTLGPLHLKNDDSKLSWFGPREFVTNFPYWQDTYNVVPCGLLANPELLYKEPSSAFPI